MLEHIFYYKFTDADDQKVYTCIDYQVALSMVKAAEWAKHEYLFEKIEVLVLKEHEDYDREVED